MTRVIALLGPAGAGKSTIAAHLAESYGARRYMFADLLKRIAMRTLDFTEAQCYGTQLDKETIDPRYGFTPRWFLQRLGTEGVRATLGESFWVDATLRAIAKDGPALAVIEDARFPNETAAVRFLTGVDSGHVWRVVAPGIRETTADAMHASEALIDAAFDPILDDTIAPPERGIPLLRKVTDFLCGVREIGRVA